MKRIIINKVNNVYIKNNEINKISIDKNKSNNLDI